MKRSDRVREPIQVYLDTDDRRLLDRVAKEAGLSRAEVLRKGLRSFAAQRSAGRGPMQALMDDVRGGSLPEDIAPKHDEYLARAYTDRHRT